MSRLKRFAFIPVLALVVLVAAGCTETEDPSQRERAVADRQNAMTRAERVAPAPAPQNFPIRKALVKYTERQDLIDHPWYVYVMGMNGEYIGYYVGQTYPQSTCNFLSSTEIVDDRYRNSLILTAPSYDGIYYGGGAASASCDSLFMFDVETDAMIVFSAPAWFASDVPLDVEARRLNNTEEVEVPPVTPVPTEATE